MATRARRKITSLNNKSNRRNYAPLSRYVVQLTDASSVVRVVDLAVADAQQDDDDDDDSRGGGRGSGGGGGGGGGRARNGSDPGGHRRRSGLIGHGGWRDGGRNGGGGGGGSAAPDPRSSASATREVFDVTCGRFYDAAPAWDPDGALLYFISSRDHAPRFDALHFAMGFTRAQRPYCVLLKVLQKIPRDADAKRAIIDRLQTRPKQAAGGRE